MKTTSLNTVSLINNASQDKTLKQGSLEQSSSSFSNVIGNITIANQKAVTNLSSAKSTNTLDSKNTKNQLIAKDNANTAVKNKLDNCDSAKEDISKMSEMQDTQNVTTDETQEDKLNSKDALDEAAEEIKNILLDVLKISEEDLKSAMEVLGLEYLDCLDKNNLAQLLTQVSGNTDMSVLITDETLYQQFNEVLTLVNDVKGDILAELGISEEELLTTLEQLNSNNLDDASAVVTDNLSNTSHINTQAMEETMQESVSASINTKDETSLKQDKVVTDVAKEITNETTIKVNNDTSNTSNGGEQQMTDNQEELAAKQPDTVKLSETIDNSDFHEYVLGQGKQENVVNSNLENVVPVNEKSTVDVESIVKQIQNQIKITANMDTTKLEFQLNPEHLGKLTIQIASKEGTVTAQIAAQNLAVKEVIESQIVQLRENMNNQGLKVDAVEVTVESHEFERNLDEGNRNGKEEQFEQQQKNSRRQLNYNDLTTLEDLSEEDALIAEMMIGNGNSINYSA